ncbi:hypothetical protein GCK72_009572 [Caenorhabditis remanei]|nr:hypothetical protein GCK72_009572 [Caenorhabditis remanei]KAF1761316.1 hypothetical protein GCK72_009572 [Caenorhabditis remanei]
MLPSEAYSTVDEYKLMKQAMKRIVICILIGCLILTKLFSISTVIHNEKIFAKIADLTIYLSLSGIGFFVPMYFSAAFVKGYNVFLVCACGSLVVEAAEFFLFLGVFGAGKWIMLEMGNLSLLLLVLTLIENGFEAEKRNEENIALTETNTIPYVADNESQIGTDGLTDKERDQKNLAIWREFRRQMWRTRSL